jgi:O-antigen ligase
MCGAESFILAAMTWNSYSLGLLAASPWLMGAVAGPIPHLGSWLLAASALAWMLLFQSARCWPQSLALAAGLSVCMAFVQFAGGAAGFAPWISESAPGEMVANLRQRNQLATLMAIGLLALLCGLQKVVFERGGRSRTFASGLAVRGVIGGAIFLAFGNALSGSRTGLMQWLAVAGMAWVWRRSWNPACQWVLGVAFLAYGLGVLLAPWLAQMAGHANTGLLGRSDDANAFSRLALWSNVLELIWQQPLLGHGWRSLAYAHYSNDFSGARFMELLDNAHNLPLHLAVELGLPVALAFCGLVGWMIFRNKPWAETRADRQLAWSVLLMIGIHSLVEYPLWYGPFFMTAVICTAVLCGDLWRNWLLGLTEYGRHAVYLGVRSCAVLLLATTAYIAFDYHRVSQIYLAAEQRSSGYAADPLAAAKQSVFFQSYAKFAELQITPLSRATAPRILALSSELVHWSPEPRIIEKLIESSVMMGLDDLAMFHLKRYRIAYPAAHAAWAGRTL